MGQAQVQADGWCQLICQSGWQHLGCAAVVIGIGDFDVLYILDGCVLCLIALFFFLARLKKTTLKKKKNGFIWTLSKRGGGVQSKSNGFEVFFFILF